MAITLHLSEEWLNILFADKLSMESNIGPSSSGASASSSSGGNSPAHNSHGSGSRSPSPLGYDPRQPDPTRHWTRLMERQIMRTSYRDLSNFRAANPGIDPVHTGGSLRQRLLSYRARSILHRGIYPVGSLEHQSCVEQIDEYNAFLNSNNPPLLNERV